MPPARRPLPSRPRFNQFRIQNARIGQSPKLIAPTRS
jgi:hypothetical protein